MDEGKEKEGWEGGKGEGKEKEKSQKGGRVRKDSISSVGSAGSLDSFWGKKRKDREDEEGEGDEKEGKGFKRSGLTQRSPVRKEMGRSLEREEEVGGMERMIKEMMMEMRKLREEVRADREERRRMEEEMRKEREERRRVEEEWREEKRRWEKGMREERTRREKMEERMDRWESREKKMDEVFDKVLGWEKEKMKTGSKVEEGEGIGEEWRCRVRRMEIRQDKKEREGRRNNVVVRGIGVEGKEVKEEIRKLWERMGVEETGIKEVMKIGRTGREGGGMLLVKLGSREDKRKVMEAKKKLRGRRERIEDDLTEEERRVKWKIEREAEREREKGRKVQVGYMKMWVDGKVRRWDELGEKWYEEQGNE